MNKWDYMAKGAIRELDYSMANGKIIDYEP